jgi:hypothetical protein
VEKFTNACWYIYAMLLVIPLHITDIDSMLPLSYR